MAGRPVTPPRFARLRRDAWTRACKHSSLSQTEIAEVIGMSLATVRSYSSATGNVPSEEAIAAVKRTTCCARSTRSPIVRRRERQRWGAEALRLTTARN